MNPKRESNPYDKIFKENAESIFLPLIAQKLGIEIHQFKQIKENSNQLLKGKWIYFMK